MSARPRIAIIGFGMSGVGAAHALFEHARFTASDIDPQLTILEASARPGGKAAPDNLGAQFLDRDALYPFDRILDDYDVKLHPAREDYELVRLTLRSTVIAPETFRHALRALRAAMLRALETTPFAQLDAMTVQQFLHKLKKSGALDDDGVAAMRQRMLLEDGTVKLSALAYALSLVKYTTPARRVEVKGGLYRVAASARDDALSRGAEVQLGARVSHVRASASDVHVTWHQQGVRHERTFDRAILALAPEHVRDVRIAGDVAPIVRVLASLTPARITKSNIVFTGGAKTHEHATERYAMWFSPNRAKTETTATFFHGWDGATPLSMQQMWKAALAVSSRRRVVRATSRTWDATVVEHGEFPHGYVSEPRVGECLPLLRAARAHYFGDERHALWCASHALGIGANVREAALTGEWAAVACLRSLGCDVARAFARVADPERELFGVPRATLDRALKSPSRS